MAKSKKQTPKNNKFAVKADPAKRRSILVTEMLQSGKSGGKVFTDKKKKASKERCRKDKGEE
jgi:hypothetical protein